MKFFLLTAGENYYPRAGDEDWIGVFETRKEAQAMVSEHRVTRTITRGKRKGETEEIDYGYRIQGREDHFDWYEIVDLRDWMVGEHGDM